MGNIRFYILPEQEIGKIKPLWEKLNQHHFSISLHFQEKYRDFTFEKRVSKLNEYEKQIHLLVAEDTLSQKLIGYCLSSISKEKTGEIDSLCVDDAYRGQKIGEYMMNEASKWLDEQNATRKILSVAVGNTRAENFYKKLGYYPAYTVFELK